jgi:hypothetical protein
MDNVIVPDTTSILCITIGVNLMLLGFFLLVSVAIVLSHPLVLWRRLELTLMSWWTAYCLSFVVDIEAVDGLLDRYGEGRLGIGGIQN